MADPPQDDQPPMVVAMQWVHQITIIGLEMALPAGLGYWLDRRWGTDPWLVSVGAVLGFAIAMQQLMQLAAKSDRDRKSKNTKSQD